MKISNLVSSLAVPILIFLGVGLILVSVWLPNKKIDLDLSDKFVASVIEKNGQAEFQHDTLSSPTELNLKTKLRLFDSIRTFENAETSIQLNNTGQFRILEKSEVTIDQLDNKSLVVVVKSGQILVEALGKGFWIRSDGKLFAAYDYALAENKNTKLIDAQPEMSAKKTLSQIEIEDTLSLKKDDFFRCYGQLIQKNSHSIGEVLLAFTIQETGRPTKVEVSKSEIQDLAFKSCLIEVVSRTKFRSFEGNPVATVFPLKFE